MSDKAQTGHLEIASESSALEALRDRYAPQARRERAIHYLALNPSQAGISQLVQALQDDDFGVRWEAAAALSRLGRQALPELLKALADPRQAGNPRLREGAYHVIHYSRGSFYPLSLENLRQALKSPAADIAAMKEAARLLYQIEHRGSN